MSRIKDKFDKLAIKNEKALITFVTAGDPDIETTARLVLAMEKSGADIIELGIPYSDPIAEGPVIQRANLRARKNDVSLGRIFSLVKDIRRKSEIPLVFLMYINCILQYGPDRFFDSCKKSGVDAVILPDLPYEEQGEIMDVAVKHGIDIISMVAPTSLGRIKDIAANARGFLYCVSSLGVTGVRSNFSTDFESFFEAVNKYKVTPAAVGFGISSPQSASQMARYCDGVIVGSAIVKLIEDAESKDKAIDDVAKFTASLKNAILEK